MKARGGGSPRADNAQSESWSPDVNTRVGGVEAVLGQVVVADHERHLEREPAREGRGHRALAVNAIVGGVAKVRDPLEPLLKERAVGERVLERRHRLRGREARRRVDRPPLLNQCGADRKIQLVGRIVA
jgi:hypothetical protein